MSRGIYKKILRITKNWKFFLTSNNVNLKKNMKHILRFFFSKLSKHLNIKYVVRKERCLPHFNFDFDFSNSPNDHRGHKCFLKYALENLIADFSNLILQKFKLDRYHYHHHHIMNMTPNFFRKKIWKLKNDEKTVDMMERKLLKRIINENSQL